MTDRLGALAVEGHAALGQRPARALHGLRHEFLQEHHVAGSGRHAGVVQAEEGVVHDLGRRAAQQVDGGGELPVVQPLVLAQHDQVAIGAAVDLVEGVGDVAELVHGGAVRAFEHHDRIA